jgi:hypothetical protein
MWQLPPSQMFSGLRTRDIFKPPSNFLPHLSTPQSRQTRINMVKLICSNCLVVLSLFLSVEGWLKQDDSAAEQNKQHQPITLHRFSPQGKGEHRQPKLSWVRDATHTPHHIPTPGTVTKQDSQYKPKVVVTEIITTDLTQPNLAQTSQQHPQNNQLPRNR